MTKESIVFILGILLLIVPHLGVPEEWKFYFFIFTGVVLVVVGYMLRRAAYLRSLEQDTGERRADSFVEQTPHSS